MYREYAEQIAIRYHDPLDYTLNAGRAIGVRETPLEDGRSRLQFLVAEHESGRAVLVSQKCVIVEEKTHGYCCHCGGKFPIPL